MKVERILPPPSQPAFIIRLTLAEAIALRKVLYNSELKESVDPYCALVDAGVPRP